MSLPIISADERLKETKGIKGCIFGKSGIGKTSLLWTLPAEKTLFFDLEAGDLAIEGWQGDTIRPRTWQDCRDIAAFIGGPNPALRDEQPWINTTRYSSTVSPLPDACVSTGARASRRHFLTKQANRIRVVLTACMGRK